MPEHRLTFLIVETQPAEGLSTRKLLIETARHNVITAYSGQEAVDTLRRFPNVDAIVFDTGLQDLTCEQFAKELKRHQMKCVLIALVHRNFPKETKECTDKIIYNDDPAGLLKLLEKEFGVRPE